MVGRQVAGDEQRLVEVGPGHGLHRRGAQGVALHRQVAGDVAIERDPHLRVERLGVEARDLGEHRADLGARHAVTGDVVEADLGQRVADLPRRAFERAGLAREVRAEVDDGDGVSASHHPSLGAKS